MNLLPGESSGVSSSRDLGKNSKDSREPDTYTAVYVSLRMHTVPMPALKEAKQEW
jgi:hypothetical protein